MKFAAGYQISEFGEPFSDIVADYSDKVREVYFPWVAQPSGRPPLTLPDSDLGEAESILLAELKRIKAFGMQLDLLFNANCYGGKAVSKSFESEIIGIIDRLSSEGVRPDIVTTTSLFVARTVKKHFPDIRTRASVNMRIGTLQGMKYASDLFDGFYLQRDMQRNLDYVKKVSAFCRDGGKELCMLVNSGCLRYCPGQVFHDNLIAHCTDASSDRVPGYNPHVCWNLYAGGRNAAEILKATWIRPEDVRNYAEYIDIFKLATRQHAYPRSVISAYAKEKWDGNLLELLEPGFSPAFFPYEINNEAFPDDFWINVGKCLNGCTDCGYCESVLEKVYRRQDDGSVLMAGF